MRLSLPLKLGYLQGGQRVGVAWGVESVLCPDSGGGCMNPSTCPSSQNCTNTQTHSSFYSVSLKKKKGKTHEDTNVVARESRSQVLKAGPSPPASGSDSTGTDLQTGFSKGRCQVRVSPLSCGGTNPLGDLASGRGFLRGTGRRAPRRVLGLSAARCGAWAEARHPKEAATGRQVQRGRSRRSPEQKRASVSWVSLPGSVAQGGAPQDGQGTGSWAGAGRCAPGPWEEDRARRPAGLGPPHVQLRVYTALPFSRGGQSVPRRAALSRTWGPVSQGGKCLSGRDGRRRPASRCSRWGREGRRGQGLGLGLHPCPGAVLGQGL